MDFDGNSINWTDLAKEAEGAFEPVPVGTYTCVINSAEATKSSGGKPMFKVTYKIQDGPHAGRIIYNNITLSEENPRAVMMFFKNMAAMGLDKAFWASNPSNGTICGKLEGQYVGVKVTHREWNGEMREQVGGLIKSNQSPAFQKGAGGAQIPSVPTPAASPAPTPSSSVPNIPAPVPQAAPTPPAAAQVAPAATPTVPVNVPEPAPQAESPSAHPASTPASDPSPASSPSSEGAVAPPPLPF